MTIDFNNDITLVCGPNDPPAIYWRSHPAAESLNVEVTGIHLRFINQLANTIQRTRSYLIITAGSRAVYALESKIQPIAGESWVASTKSAQMFCEIQDFILENRAQIFGQYIDRGFEIESFLKELAKLGFGQEASKQDAPAIEPPTVSEETKSLTTWGNW